MNARPQPAERPARWVSADLFERVIDGAMADHCHKTNPRIAPRATTTTGRCSKPL